MTSDNVRKVAVDIHIMYSGCQNNVSFFVFAETQAGFKAEFLGIMERLYQVSLDELKKREAERVDIEKGITAAKANVDEECVDIIDNFSNVKDEVFETLSEMAEQLLDLDPEAVSDSQVNSVESLRSDYRMKVRQVWESLMEHEMMLVNSIEFMIVEYETRLGAMTNGFLDSAGSLIQTARDTETMYFQHLLDQAEGVAGIDHVRRAYFTGYI